VEELPFGDEESKESATGHTASEHAAQQAAKLDGAILRKFHAVGHTLYGDAWDDKRPELVKAATKGRATSASDLTEAEINKLIAGMQKKINAGESALAQPSETMPA